MHLTGSRTEGKHAVLCLKSAAFEKASTVACSWCNILITKLRCTSVWATDQLVDEVMRELELVPGQDPASQKAMQLANARCRFYFNFLKQSWPCSPQRSM